MHLSVRLLGALRYDCINPEFEVCSGLVSGWHAVGSGLADASHPKHFTCMNSYFTFQTTLAACIRSLSSCHSCRKQCGEAKWAAQGSPAGKERSQDVREQLLPPAPMFIPRQHAALAKQNKTHTQNMENDRSRRQRSNLVITFRGSY